MIQCTHPGCTAQYRRKEHLTRHVRKHLPSSTFTCDVCSKGFDRIDSLRRHKLLHANETGARASKACDRCHAAKIRCDGKMPCGGCVRKGVECSFERATGGQNTTRAGAQGISIEDLVNDVAMTDQDQESLSEGEPSAESPKTPLSRTEIEEMLAHHENTLREKGILARTGTGTENQEGGKELDIDYYVDVYFSHFHYQWPLVHARSFRLGKEPQIMLLSIVMVGLWISGEKAAREKAEGMHEKLLTLLENRMDDWVQDCEFEKKAWPVPTYQALVLNIYFAILRDARQDIYERCRFLLHAVTKTCMAGGLYDYGKMRAQIEPSDSVVFSWTYIEEAKLLALAIFKLNHHFDTGMLSLSDLRIPPTDSGYLWDAPKTKDFYQRYHLQLESGTIDETLICDIVKDVKQGKMGPGAVLQSDPWLGLLISQCGMWNRAFQG